MLKWKEEKKEKIVETGKSKEFEWSKRTVWLCAKSTSKVHLQWKQQQ